MRGSKRIKGVKTVRLTRALNIICPKCSSNRVWNKERFDTKYECMKCKFRFS